MHFLNLSLLAVANCGSLVLAVASPAISSPTSPISPVVTAQATLGSAPCNSAASIINVCEASTPNFEDLCFHDAQSCLCSTSGTWAPNFFDDYWSSCLAWAMVSDTQFYSALLPSNGVQQSRKCQTWGAFTQTGGIPSDCATSAPVTRSSASLAPGTSTAATSTAAAVRLMGTGRRAPLVLVLVNVVNIYILA